MAKKPKVYEFTTIEQLHSISADRVDHFCRDLALWLLMHKIASQEGGLRSTSPRDVFGWIDDNKHHAEIRVTHKEVIT